MIGNESNEPGIVFFHFMEYISKTHCTIYDHLKSLYLTKGFFLHCYVVVGFLSDFVAMTRLFTSANSVKLYIVYNNCDWWLLLDVLLVVG